MKFVQKILIFICSIGCIIIFSWFSWEWFKAGQTIKHSEAYWELKHSGPISFDISTVEIIISIQHWNVEPPKICSVFEKTPNVSNYVLRDIAKTRNFIERAYIVCRLESEFSQNDLMEYFLMNAYGGRGKYGVEAIAINLFDKPFELLSEREVIQVGLFIRSPSLEVESDKLKSRTDYWVNRLDAEN